MLKFSSASSTWCAMGLDAVGHSGTVGLLTAFWFGAVATHQRKDEISRLQKIHAKELGGILMNAERAEGQDRQTGTSENLAGSAAYVYPSQNQGRDGVCGGDWNRWPAVADAVHDARTIAADHCGRGIGWLGVAYSPGKGQVFTAT